MENTVTRGIPDPIDVFVGSRVRTCRLGQRISQTKLGDAVGVTFQQIQKYENGSNRIGAGNLYKIARTLGVEVSHFFAGLPANAYKGGGLTDVDLAKMDGSLLLSKEAVQLSHSYFRILDPQVRKNVFQLVRSLAESYAKDTKKS